MQRAAWRSSEGRLHVSVCLSFSSVSFFSQAPSVTVLEVAREHLVPVWRDKRQHTHTHKHKLIHFYFIHTRTHIRTRAHAICTVQSARRHILCYVNKPTRVAGEAPTQMHVLSLVILLVFFIISLFSSATINSPLFLQIASPAPLLYHLFSFSRKFFFSQISQLLSILSALPVFSVPQRGFCPAARIPFFRHLWKNPHQHKSSKQITHVQHILRTAIYLLLLSISYRANHPQTWWGASITTPIGLWTSV